MGVAAMKQINPSTTTSANTIHTVTPNDFPDRILRAEEVLRMCGFASKSSLNRAVREGFFPRPVKLTRRSVGWRLSATSEWIATRPEVGAEDEV